MSKELKIQPVILSGGSGTRLWPLSRESYPKQYISLNSASELSFLQRTLKRLDGISNLENPIIICNENHRFIVAEQMRELMIKPKAIILEPFGRNTAPAIATAAFQAMANNRDYILLILSSDHEIKQPDKFREAIKASYEDAKKGNLIALGTIPFYPSTGFGYIQTNNEVKKYINTSLPILKFIEKPNIEKAKNLIKDSNTLWNSGIFIFRASSIIEELKIHEPKLLKICEESFNKSSDDFDFKRLHLKSFEKCPNVSIDIAVMEKTTRGFVLPFDADWDDIGNWESLWKSEKKDKNGNVIKGDIYYEEVKNSYLRSEKRLVVALGVENLILVETQDAILLSSPQKSEKIKLVVEKLNKKNRLEGKLNSKVFRPWGYFLSIEKGHNWQIKKIVVKPKSSLSLQKHKYRSEHWIILEGMALIENENSKYLLKENESTYIPIGAKHRLSNPGEVALTIIEVQSGSYLGENDIIRYEDNYGRLNTP